MALLPTPPLISAADLAEALGGEAAPVLIDCRYALDDPEAGRQAWLRERIPGAHFADLARDFSGPVRPGHGGRHPMPDPAKVIRRLRGFGVGPDTPVVFYDAQGSAFAARGWWLACHLGHPHARILDGGLGAWSAAGGELDRQPPGPAPTPAPPWPPRAPLLQAVDADTVAALLTANADADAKADADAALLDARSPERFAGEQEPIDPVAGHIPGARCLPHVGNLQPDGRLLPPAALGERWQGIDADAAICYCGSGVTAAHNVLAAVVAGVGRPRLYVGSWSEWISDPDRPIARSAQ